MKKLLCLLVITVCASNSFAYYQAEQGRWLSRDPIGENGGENLYTMLENNSITHVDILGLVCGSWWNDWIVPDKPLFFDFGSSCQDHDDCYGECGRGKRECDRDFLKNIYTACNSYTAKLKYPILVRDQATGELISSREGSINLQKICKRLGRMYHGAVVKHGQGAYDNAQKKACDSCKTTLPTSGSSQNAPPSSVTSS